MKKLRHVYIDDDVHRIAKTVASMRGVALNKYFEQRVIDDVKNMPKEMLSTNLFEQKPKAKRGFYDDIFK